MIDVTPELISIYADGAASLEEAAKVEAAVAADPGAAAMLEEFKNLESLLCPSAAEEATEVVPDPTKGSTTISPGFELTAMSRSMNRSGFSVGCVVSFFELQYANVFTHSCWDKKLNVRGFPFVR